MALAAYGFVATFQPDPHFGRILAHTAASSSPDRWRGAWWSMDSGPTAGIGAAICLLGVAVIMYEPRTATP
jgi:small multidrug resistance family-3 protein